VSSEAPIGEGQMSLMEHLTELRYRLIKAFQGIFVGLCVGVYFSEDVLAIIRKPVLKYLGPTGGLVYTGVLDKFMAHLKVGVLTGFVITCPYWLYHLWAFISPGLYPKERRWAVPFVVCTGGLFIMGGLFAYFIAFRYALVFLLGIGAPSGVKPFITIDRYFSLFVNVMLGISLVFELPVIIFFLTLIRVASPSFLLRHSRYAILAIVILAAIITPTPDVFNLTLFAVPMILLFFLGVFASYLLVMRRENRRFPWRIFVYWLLAVLAVLVICVFVAVVEYHYHFVIRWPFLAK